MRQRIGINSFYDPSIQRIDVLDSRFYFSADNPSTFYPSVTTILEAYPKGFALTEWHKALGFNADIILERKARQGSNIHDAIKDYVSGIMLVFGNMVENKFVANYTLAEWEMIVKFVEFWTEYNPELIAAEVALLNDELRVGGTIDLVFRLMNSKGKFENWILDTKTGNGIYPSHELQLSAYATMWNKQYPEITIDRAGILHLDALTRGADKKDKKIQGKGWQIKEFDRHYKDAFKVFEHLRVIWDQENIDYIPKIYSLPGTLQLKPLA